MTVADLEGAVARLGFAPSIEDGRPLLLDAAERALAEITAVRPRVATATLWHLAERPLFRMSLLEEIEGEKSFSLPDGSSFYLETLGRGQVSFRRGEGQMTLSPAVTAGRVTVTAAALPTGEGTVECILSGVRGFRVPMLAIYESPYEADEPPRSPTAGHEYSLPAICPDYHSLCEPPRLADGRPLFPGAEGEYTVEGETLRVTIPEDARLTLTYRKRLTFPAEGEIDLAAEEAALLPLFCAAYVYLDDDPDKAAFYLGRFREGLAAIVPGKESLAVFRDVLAWG